MLVFEFLCVRTSPANFLSLMLPKVVLVFSSFFEYLIMVLTRSQVRSGQTPDQTASSRADTPGGPQSNTLSISQQSSTEGGVTGNNEAFGGSSLPVAAGNERPPAGRKCRSDCLTCPDLIRIKQFKSFSTGRFYSALDIEPTAVNCKIQNYIYLLSCKSCGLQYVGESIVPVHKRMNTHRTAKSGCTTSIEHYREVCPGAGFTIQIIEKLPGNGYTNGVMDKDVLRYRLQREDYWMKTLRTIYPYGLNEKTKDMNKDLPVGKLFPSLPRYGLRFVNQRSRAKNPINQDHLINIHSFLDYIFSLPTFNRGNEVRKILDSLKQTKLKSLASQANNSLESSDPSITRWLLVIIDVFFTKVYKETSTQRRKAPQHILPIYFHNKGMEFIKLSAILRGEDVVNLLPRQFQDDEVPSIVYSLSGTVRNEIFNYKQTVNSINTKDTVTFGTGIVHCDCASSPFVDKDHKHIVTGDLRIITNNKLRNLIKKGPNYREPRSINWGKCRGQIELGLDVCIEKMMSSKKDIPADSLLPWKEEIMRRVDLKISDLKKRIQPKHTSPTLKQAEVSNYLSQLHDKFVLVPIDKAANNVAIVCKKFYVQVILREIGASGAQSINQTYIEAGKSPQEIVSESQEYTKRLGLEIEDKDMALPSMYWMPKMHKSPSGARFIIASKHCATKPISKAVSNAFKLIFKQVDNFHSKAKFLSNYNKFWVLQNSEPILSILRTINKKKNAKSIATYDFSTLYTKLPHRQLIDRLSDIIEFVYKGGDKSYIKIGSSGKAYWARAKGKGVAFTKGSLKMAVAHLIENCYFMVGDKVMRQAVGIPMGIDPAPFWANLFLYSFEEQYITSLIADDRKGKARCFHSTKRFIDDLCAINDGGEFGRCFRDIYPPELELKVEGEGTEASFLNLHIRIQDGVFVYGLYDKRDDFPFFIVRMPHRDSNIPQTIFYSALVGEFLRIARSTLMLPDFIPKATELITRMQNQGAQLNVLKKALNRIINKHPNSFKQFQLPADSLVNLVV